MISKRALSRVLFFGLKSSKVDRGMTVTVKHQIYIYLVNGG